MSGKERMMEGRDGGGRRKDGGKDKEDFGSFFWLLVPSYYVPSLFGLSLFIVNDMYGLNSVFLS